MYLKNNIDGAFSDPEREHRVKSKTDDSMLTGNQYSS